MDDWALPGRRDELDDDYSALLAWMHVQFSRDLAVLQAFPSNRRQQGQPREGSGPWAIWSLMRDIATFDVVVEAIDRSRLAAGTVPTAFVNDVNRIASRYRHRSGHRLWQPNE